MRSHLFTKWTKDEQRYNDNQNNDSIANEIIYVAVYKGLFGFEY